MGELIDWNAEPRQLAKAIAQIDLDKHSDAIRDMQRFATLINNKNPEAPLVDLHVFIQTLLLFKRMNAGEAFVSCLKMDPSKYSNAHISKYVELFGFTYSNAIFFTEEYLNKKGLKWFEALLYKKNNSTPHPDCLGFTLSVLKRAIIQEWDAETINSIYTITRHYIERNQNANFYTCSSLIGFAKQDFFVEMCMAVYANLNQEGRFWFMDSLYCYIQPIPKAKELFKKVAEYSPFENISKRGVVIGHSDVFGNFMAKIDAESAKVYYLEGGLVQNITMNKNVLLNL